MRLAIAGILLAAAASTASAGPTLRFGLTGALSDQAAPEQHELGPTVAIGERIGPILAELDYAYLSFMDTETGANGMQRVGLNVKADVIRNLNPHCRHRWMACTRGSSFYVEGGIAERYGQWHLDAIQRQPADSDREREYHVGFGIELDNRLSPWRYGWQVGLRFAFASHDPMTEATCRTDGTCMPVPNQRSIDRAVLLEWTFLIGH